MAVCDAQDTVTYRDLEHWTNALAEHLDQLVGPAPTPCLLISKYDCAGVAGLLACAKTRHRVVAVDADTPFPVIETIIADVQPAACLLTGSARHVAISLAASDIPIVLVEGFRHLTSQGTGLGPVQPDDICALRRTSGTTGASKLIASTHTAELSRAARGAAVNQVTRASCYAIATSIDSGMGRGGLLRALLTGATLFPLDLLREPPRAAATRLMRSGITHLQTTPTALRLLASGVEDGACFERLEYIHLGGEQAKPADLHCIKRIAPERCMLNQAYSSSETGLIATCVTSVGDLDPMAQPQLEIRPGVTVEILGEDGLPTAGSGRIRAASPSVSSGYVGAASAALNTRYGRSAEGLGSVITDDIGHLTAEGRLVVERRMGAQVKIRGTRVDLGDLEAWLMDQDGVRDALALVRQAPPNDTSELVAVAVSAGDLAAVKRALQARMRAALPSAMQPAHLLVLERLPETPAMKIDRQAILRSLDRPKGPAPTARGTSLRDHLRTAWHSALGPTQADQGASFFDAGGDSVSATALALHLEDLAGLPLDAGFVFRHPTFDAQMHALEAAARAPQRPRDPLLVPLGGAEGEAERRLFVLPGGGGHVFPFAPMAQALAPRWHTIGLLHPRLRPEERPILTVEDVATRFLQALESAPQAGPIFLMGYSIGGLAAHEMARRLQAAGRACAVVVIDTRPWSLASWRTRLDRDWKAVQQGYHRAKGRLRGGAAPDTKDPVAPHTRLDLLMAPISASARRFRLGRSDAPVFLIQALDSARPGDRPDYGWSQVAPVVGRREVPGNHYTLIEADHQVPFCAAVDQGLDALETWLAGPGRAP